MKPMAKITAKRLFAIADVAGRNVVSVQAASSGGLLLLAMDQVPESRWSGLGWANVSRKPQASLTFRVHHVVDGQVRTTILPPTEQEFSLVQTLGHHAFVLVNVRCAEGAENIFIYSRDGQLIHAFHGGDGIEDVRTTGDDRIWLGYFDKGVFGDGVLGNCGLTCFKPDGSLAFDYIRIARQQELPLVTWCFSLNAANHELWMYYSAGPDEAPLVRLTHDGRCLGFWPDIPVDVDGGFAVANTDALFALSFEAQNTLHHLKLGSMHVREVQVVDEVGQPLSFYHAAGQGPLLYLINAEYVYQVDVRSL